MHELILELVRDQPTPAALARFPLDDGALVCAFRDAERPRWVAKTAFGATGIRRLQAEAQALGYLEPWAERLGLPRLLGWDDGADAADGSACLAQTGLDGTPARGAAALSRPWAPLPEETREIAEWLLRFQTSVRPRTAVALGELDRAARAQMPRDCQAAPPYAALLLPLLAALPPLVEPNRPAEAAHGDFWAGNVLFDAHARQLPQVRVIDWSGFGPATALDDLLTWTAHLGARRYARLGRLGRWQALFFSPGTIREYLRAFAARRAYGEALARWAFYLFLIRRLRWELGLDLQTRNDTERAAAQAEWTEIVAWLQQRRYPDPFTPMPV